MSRYRYATKTLKDLSEIEQAMIDLGWKESLMRPALELVRQGHVLKIQLRSGKEAFHLTSNQPQPPGRFIIISRTEK